VRDPQAVGPQVYAVAETGLALYDFAQARPRRLAPEAREQVAAHLGDPVRFRWAGR
jgi:acyl-CoA thioester hydrolase